MGIEKITLSETVVKYLFSGVDCEVAVGEDGYVVYGFKALYPSRLGVFVPIEVDRSNYCLMFPKSFDAYFMKLDDEFAYLSRLLEVDVKSDFLGYGIEYLPGSILKRDDDEYAIFRFDKLLDSSLKTDLLCRIQSDNLEVFSKLIALKPSFLTEATDLTGKNYFYFILPIHSFFDISDGIIAAVFSFLQSMHTR